MYTVILKTTTKHIMQRGIAKKLTRKLKQNFKKHLINPEEGKKGGQNEYEIDETN